MKWIGKQLKELFPDADRRILTVVLINIISGCSFIILLEFNYSKIWSIIYDLVFSVYVSSFLYGGYKLLRAIQDYNENDIDRDD